MVLKVTFEDFAEAVRQYTGGKDAFLAELPSGASATAGSPNSGVIVSAVTELTPAKAKEYLTLAGLKVHEGTWALEADDPIIGGEQAFFCAVAYRSREIMPGLWLDVFPYEPSRADVLRAMYDEFIHNGEMKEVTFDEFVRSSFANVVILSPDIAKGLITKKLADEKF